MKNSYYRPFETAKQCIQMPKIQGKYSASIELKKLWEADKRCLFDMNKQMAESNLMLFKIVAEFRNENDKSKNCFISHSLFKKSH